MEWIISHGRSAVKKGRRRRTKKKKKLLTFIVISKIHIFISLQIRWYLEYCSVYLFIYLFVYIVYEIVVFFMPKRCMWPPPPLSARFRECVLVANNWKQLCSIVIWFDMIPFFFYSSDIVLMYFNRIICVLFCVLLLSRLFCGFAVYSKRWNRVVLVVVSFFFRWRWQWRWHCSVLLVYSAPFSIFFSFTLVNCVLWRCETTESAWAYLLPVWLTFFSLFSLWSHCTSAHSATSIFFLQCEKCCRLNQAFLNCFLMSFNENIYIYIYILQWTQKNYMEICGVRPVFGFKVDWRLTGACNLSHVLAVFQFWKFGLLLVVVVVVDIIIYIFFFLMLLYFLPRHCSIAQKPKATNQFAFMHFNSVENEVMPSHSPFFFGRFSIQ